jgi:predicted nucleotidyltransferase
MKADMTAISSLRQHLGNNRRDGEIQAFCGELVERYRPLKITLFGSHASGLAREDSDVDILVEMERVDSALGMAAAIVRETRPVFAVDILVRTPRQVKERVRMGDPFMIEIVNSGKVIYETADR